MGVVDAVFQIEYNVFHLPVPKAAFFEMRVNNQVGWCEKGYGVANHIRDIA